MTQMRIALRALYFGTEHAMCYITMLANDLGIKWCVITWPATTSIKLSRRDKQRRTAAHTVIATFVPMIPVATCKRWLGGGMASNGIRSR